MLKKLIRYEFRCTARYLGIMLAVFAGYLLLYFGIMQFYIHTVPTAVTTILFVMATIGLGLIIYVVFYAAYFYCIYRFYKNLVTDEGYLMHTLPVTPKQLVLSKLIVALTWNVLTLICTAASVIMLIFGMGAAFPEPDVPSSELQVIFTPAVIIPILLGVLFLIASLSYSFLIVYYSISLGQTKNSYRAAWSLVIYLGINFAGGIITGIAMIIPTVISITLEDPLIIITVMLALMTLVYTLISVLMYRLTCKTFRNRLNLI